MLRPVAVACAAALLLSAAASAAPDARASPARVLFIGNSLTYANDLPGMTASLSDGGISTTMVAFPDYSLEDHWRQGDALRAIRRGGWTHVVLQQGPSSLPESRRRLVQQARRFAREIEKAGAKTVLYGIWPPASRHAAQPAVTASYDAAARASGGALVAVGEGWREAWARDATLPLYGPDGFHPSALGTYLAALMFVAHLTGQPAPAPLQDAHGASLRQLRAVHAAAASAAAAR